MRRSENAFTLIELLVVLGVITLLAGSLTFALRDAAKTAALTSAQIATSQLFANARTLANSRGIDAVVLLNTDATSPQRYLRFLAVGLWSGNTVTEISDTLLLPEGIYVLPNTSIATANPSTVSDTLTLVGLNWDRPSLSGFQSLRSTALDGTLNSFAINSPTAERWSFFRITPRGTTASNGNIVLAHGIPQPPSANPPVRLEKPDAALGFSISVYGQQTPIASRAEF